LATAPWDVPAYGIVAGIPARLVRKRFPEETIRQLEEIAWWNWSDEEIEGALPLLLGSDIDAFIAYAMLSVRKRSSSPLASRQASHP
jgi:hypothetical protein